MVDSINLANFATTSSATNNKQRATDSASTPVNRPVGDTVVLSQKTQPKKKNFNAAQVAGLVIGSTAALGSIVVAGVFLKTSGVFGGRKLLKEIKNSTLPDNIKAILLEEYKKMKGSFTDAAGAKNYIDEVKKLEPFFKKQPPKLVDSKKAREILDKNIIGMDDIKEQVIDYIKVRNYHIKNGTFDSFNAPLIINGPAGTGKTSIAQCIAEAMEEPFANIPLAGVNEPREIIGDRRLYIGSAPGKVVKAIQESKSPNSVLFFDEADKMGVSQHGNPAHAFLDLFEPKRSKYFVDNHLGFPVDLSNTFRIVAVNSLEKLPKEILDRAHIMTTRAYTEAEKLKICNLELDKMYKDFKLSPDKVKISDMAMSQVVKRGLDEKGQVAPGARKAIDNLRQVFQKAIVQIEDNPNVDVINIDAKYADDVINKFQT